MPSQKKNSTTNKRLTTRGSSLEEHYARYSLLREQILTLLPEKMPIKVQLRIIHELLSAFCLLFVLERRKLKRELFSNQKFLERLAAEQLNSKAFLSELRLLLQKNLAPLASRQNLLHEKSAQPSLAFLFFPTIMALKSADFCLTKQALYEFLRFVESLSGESIAVILMLLSMIFENDLVLLKKNSSTTKIDRLLNKRRDTGAYYTPSSITEYMTKKAIVYYLNNHLEEKILSLESLKTGSTEWQQKVLELLQRVKILDPAVGSGEFLLSSAKTLFYWQKELLQRLPLNFSASEIKAQIIANNLFGVDLFDEALSLTNLRLFLWFLDTPSELTNAQSVVETKFEEFTGAHLFRGNSLIGSTVVAPSHSKEELEREYYSFLKARCKKNTLTREIYRLLQPFHWGLSCADVLARGGFDIILGNPPYLECKKMRNIVEKEIYAKTYVSAYKLYDLSILFLERGLQLLKPKGILLFLITNKFLSADFGLRVRTLLLSKTKLKLLVDVSYLPLFQKTATYPIIIGLENSPPLQEKKKAEGKIEVVPKLTQTKELLTTAEMKTRQYNQQDYEKLPGKQFVLSENFEHIRSFFEDDQRILFLAEAFKIHYRLLGFIDWGKKIDKLIPRKDSERDLHFIGTTNIFPFAVNKQKTLTLAKQRFKNHYLQYSPTFDKAWRVFSQQKILVKEVAHKLTAAFDPGVFASLTGVYLLIPHENFLCKYYLALLNSRVVNFIFSTLFSNIHLAGGFLRFNGSYLKQIPLIRTNSNSTRELLLMLADYLIFLQYQHFLPLEGQRQSLTNRISFFQKILDYIVYELYFRKNANFETMIHELLRMFIPIKTDNSFLKELIENKGAAANEKTIEEFNMKIETTCQKIRHSNVLQTIERLISSDSLLQRILTEY